MSLIVVGLNQRVATVDLRERFAIALRDIPDALLRLRRLCGADEAVILSTCNRTELYLSGQDPKNFFQGAVDFLASQSRLHPSAFQDRLYQWSDHQAIRHLFGVTAGLDSMVLGESEITSQVKQAYQKAQEAGATTSYLNRLFQKALHSTKLIRSRTRIAEGQASIGSVVVHLVKEKLGERLGSSQVLLWGAGKIAEATIRHLIAHTIGQLWIVNRTQSKAECLAGLCQGRWLSWQQALNHLNHVDIAIVCTQAPHYVVDRHDLEAVLPNRKDRPLILIDLAVPRNADPALRGLAGIHLYDIDDLQAIAQQGLLARQQSVAECQTIIEEQVKHFARWRENVPQPQQQEEAAWRLVATSSSA
ncbi:MAG: glutamyl-tRNA reductase [Candidatus Omnitrophica bacterium]|nr:glutamyl-tRNA reductase [Candidatus Omnitrophota bacterium]